ncbi:conjugal transfer protein TrbB [Klebsiella pneumoniae]|nr:conjugal transfer protein TrbB [Klebsiella pneumoniae]MBL2578843.1 conjugal transfer protein TrbB [Klebsiella pneumoniae]MBL2595688.1 conjugal transfer protein TrbB [Klebsiella pneumoniae]MBL2606638.1 conjugal transfer protein TrbB [Klebsiella pneumoniae]MBL2669199.1 conjugal transfer protein TrbB [Klebsiella pneumoniae]
MASINTIVKRKQYLWLGIVVVGAASAIGGALYLSDVDMSGNGEAVAEQEPVPDMTGVVDTTALLQIVGGDKLIIPFC